MAERSDDNKKKKKKDSVLEAQIMALLEKSLKAALDAAMKDLFKDFR